MIWRAPMREQVALDTVIRRVRVGTQFYARRYTQGGEQRRTGCRKYEHNISMVEVRKSGMAHGNKGLFAFREIVSGTFIAS